MARFVEWSDELSVGVEEIDEQHKVLVGLVNEMHEAILSRGASAKLKKRSWVARLWDHVH